MIDLAFPIQGERLPADHGYPLYAALTGTQPAFHRAAWLAVHPVKGLAAGEMLRLPPGSKLRLRLPSDHIADALPLVGTTLTVGVCGIRLGPPIVSPLRPSVALYSRLVVVKGFMELEPFRAAVQRQIDSLGARCHVSVGRRRTLRIKDRVIVGFAVALAELSAEESVDVQEKGLGGRRHMGCGVFAPLRGTWR